MSTNYRREMLRQGKTIPSLKTSTIQPKTSTSEINKLQQTINTLEQTIKDLQNNVSYVKTELNKVYLKTSQIKSCECDPPKINKEIESLKESLKTESIVSDSLCEELDELKETFDPTELDLIKSTLSANVTDLSSLKSLVQGNKTQCSADFSKLRSEINKLSKEIEALKKKIK